jgi:hypothetical protein
MDDASARRIALITGCSVFTVLLFLAGYFYLERMAHLDMAFQTFLILKSGLPEIQSGRFGALGTQVYPWLAQALGLPLKAVLVLYSLGHILWPFLLFGWCIRIGQWRWALVMTLVPVLMTTYTFYWLSEMPQGLVFLLAVIAWLHAKGTLQSIRWWQWPLWIVAMITAFYFHPMVMYALAFVCLFFGLEPARTTQWRLLHGTALGLFIAIALIKYKVLKLDWYDAMSIERAEAFGKLWPHWFDIQSNRDFLHWCLTDYYMIPLALILCAGYYTWKQAWIKLALVLVYPVCFVLMVNIPFSGGDNQFYLENLYLPLAVFASVPLVFEVLPGLFADKFYIPLALVLAIRLIHIGLAHEPWTERIDWEKRLLQQTARQPHRKLILSEKQAPMDKLKLSWGSPYEFLILSSLQHPDSARCIIIDETPERFDSLAGKPQLFLGEFKNYPFKVLPHRYFNPIDTSGYVRW